MHNQSISLLSSSLQVLEELVNQHMLTHQIPTPKVDTFSSSCPLQMTFNSIYSKIKQIFSMHSEQAHKNYTNLSQVKSSNGDDSCFIFNSNQNDEELYEILTMYKVENKSLKESNKGILKKLQEKQDEGIALRISIDKMRASLSQREKQIQLLQSEFQAMVAKYEDSRRENQKLVQKFQKVMDETTINTMEKQKLIETIQNLRMEVIIKERNIQELQQTVEKLQKENNSYKEQITLKVQEAIRHIPQIIDSKINEKENWNYANFSVLRKFISSNRIKN